MSWQERDHAHDEGGGFGRPGGDWHGIRPSFDNPLTWSLPLGRVSGILVRVHVIFLLFIVVRLVQSLGLPAVGERTPLGFELQLGLMGALFLIVLMHEFGHCLACRSSGGSADEILMWPLGGLAFCHPANRWQAHLATVIGGPLVNVVVCALITPVLGVATGRWWGVALPNPLSLGGIHDVAGWPLTALYLINWVSAMLLLFNLLPVFPLDGGRILQAALWPRFGYLRSMRVAIRAGYVGAILLGVVGMVLVNLLLIGVAVFGGLTCYFSHRQLEWTAGVMGESDDGFTAGAAAEEADPAPTWSERRRAARDARRRELEAVRRRAEEEEVDRILEKINVSGIDSLTAAERRHLERATDRKREPG